MGKNRNKHSKERRTFTYTRTQNLSREELQSQLSDNSKKLASGCAAFIIAFIIAFIMGAILSLLGAWVFMYAWNLGIAVAFGLAPIGYWTAFWMTAAFGVVGSFLKGHDMDFDLFDDDDE